MIRVTKSTIVPGPLRTKSRGAEATAELCRAHDAGIIDHDFLSTIYGTPKVKSALIADQFGKCVFCEAKLRHTQPGDVEHFRPKKGFIQTTGGIFTKPGYYWLAYDWFNLSFCCVECNRSHKKRYFPLFNPRCRARSHHDDVNREKPVLINPITEDPGDFIGFRKEVAYGKDDAGRGKVTIDAIGLNRQDLCESRRELLSKFKDAWNLLISVERTATAESIRIPERFVKIRRRLEKWASPSSEYSAMIKSAMEQFTKR